MFLGEELADASDVDERVLLPAMNFMRPLMVTPCCTHSKTNTPGLLLCLAPKYLDLILWALSFGLHWRVDVHERASNHHGLRSFVWALVFVFLHVIA